MKITLIRHTSVNVSRGFCYGNTDVGLASTFEKEWLVVKDKLKNNSFDFVFSSPLQRCAKLAEKLFEKEMIEYDDRLKEMNFGKWEGKNWDDIEKTPEGYGFFQDYLNVPCPGGESFLNLWDRVNSFLNYVNKKMNEKNIAIVSHGGPIRVICSVIQKLEPREAFEMKVDYGEVLFLNEEWRMKNEEWNIL